LSPQSSEGYEEVGNTDGNGDGITDGNEDGTPGLMP